MKFVRANQPAHTPQPLTLPLPRPLINCPVELPGWRTENISPAVVFPILCAIKHKPLWSVLSLYCPWGAVVGSGGGRGGGGLGWFGLGKEGMSLLFPKLLGSLWSHSTHGLLREQEGGRERERDKIDG